MLPHLHHAPQVPALEVGGEDKALPVEQGLQRRLRIRRLGKSRVLVEDEARGEGGGWDRPFHDPPVLPLRHLPAPPLLLLPADLLIPLFSHQLMLASLSADRPRGAQLVNVHQQQRLPDLDVVPVQRPPLLSPPRSHFRSIRQRACPIDKRLQQAVSFVAHILPPPLLLPLPTWESRTHQAASRVPPQPIDEVGGEAEARGEQLRVRLGKQLVPLLLLPPGLRLPRSSPLRELEGRDAHGKKALPVSNLHHRTALAGHQLLPRSARPGQGGESRALGQDSLRVSPSSLQPPVALSHPLRSLPRRLACSQHGSGNSRGSSAPAIIWRGEEGRRPVHNPGRVPVHVLAWARQHRRKRKAR
mmetsp:Transcript_2500/g.6003  ORF Transcript_2500/g.6003 Transcript_2500/m.6003 type:complete len:358 (-) Transcript_2500:101-1174(-)